MELLPAPLSALATALLPRFLIFRQKLTTEEPGPSNTIEGDESLLITVVHQLDRPIFEGAVDESCLHFFSVETAKLNISVGSTTI